ncbi:MAG: DUF4178 domain-containing protein [Actinocatenispora sp.]
MTSLVVVLLVAVLLVLVAILVIVLVARSKARQRAQQPPAPREDPFADRDSDALSGDPRRIKVGDIVEFRGQSWAVRGSLRMREGSSTWAEHLLDDAAGVKRWLSVEEDPDLILALWSEVRGATVLPGPRTLDFDGRHYRDDESGTARFNAEGTTGLDPQGTVRYHDYEAGDGALLSFEDYGPSGKWEVARGETLARNELRIYPAGS